jgi:hypothetical protein
MVADSAEVAEGSPWYSTELVVWILAIASSVSQKRFEQGKGRVGRGHFWLRGVRENLLPPIIRIPNPAMKPAKYL